MLSGNGTRRFGKALIAFFLGIAMLVGLGAGFAPSAQAASSAPSSSLVLPVQVQEAEKPDVWIETNVVLNTQKKPTGYVELVLKARTPTIYFADNEMTQLRYPGDGLETQAGRWNGTAFNAEDPRTYAVSRQTTFREVAASLQYNTKVLVPVSWEHEIEYGEGADINVIQNAYPDFFAKYYVDEDSFIKSDPDGKPNSGDEVVMEGEERSAEIRRQFAESKNQQRIAVPTLQYSTKSVSSAVSYAGGPDGLISMAVNSNADTVLPQESALAVVRFLYIGEEPIEHLLDKNSDPKIGYTVNSNKVSSWHNIQNGGSNKGDGAVNDFFWFADDTLIKQSTVQQALIYTSGKYQENISVESDKISGINQFYATKSIYNGDEIPEDQRPTYTMATVPGYVKNPTNSSEQNYTEVTPEEDTSANPTKIHRPKTDADNITVLAAARKDGDRPFSYTSNLLFTTDRGAELVDGSNENIAFTLRAGPTYKSSGGGTVDDFAAVVFIDWDDTMLGALVVPKGDARDRVEEYVEKFIHPTLRKSTAMAMEDGPAKTERLFNLSRSLDRKYTYAGSHTSDYATLAAVGGSYSEAEAAMSTDTTYLGKTIFPDGYIVDDVDMAGSSYPLTNKLDYAILRRPVDWENTQTIAAGVEGSPYVDKNGNSVAATEWVLGAIDYDGTQTPETVDDNYWYTNCWAVVKQPSKVSDVWTTFSTTGELSEAKLPAFDSTAVAAGGHAYDGRSYFNADYIRATGDATPDANMPAGTAVAATANAAGNGEMAFATYADSAYFEFADFADVKVDELFVKACYEPCEQLSWTGNYTVISEEPYYVRYGTVASTQSGNVYSISFDYGRVGSSGNGVIRARDPWTRVQYTMDEGEGTTTTPIGPNIIYAGARFYVGMKQNSTDIIAAEFTPTSAFLSLNYGVVETYGYSNFVASGARTLMENEADVEENFNYLTDTSKTESFENGYLYDNRLGSKGYVYIATLRQIMEEATKEFDNSDNWEMETGDTFKAQYFTEATMKDLNLRIDAEGTTVEGIKRNGENMDYLERVAALAKARNNLYNALKIAYYHQKFDETGVIDLDWHQLQYHILYGDSTKPLGTANGIDNGGSPDSQNGVLNVSNCGNYWWCRLDACSQKVTITITSLEELFDAVEMLDDSNPDIVAAAKGAIEATIVDFINRAEIFKSDKQVGNIKVKDDLKKFDASDVNRLIDFAQKYVKAWRDKGETGSVPTDSKILQKNYMLLNNTTPIGAINFDFTDGTTDGDYANSDKYKYWWFSFDEKPEMVDFNSLDTSNLVDLIVKAVYEYQDGPQKNEIAWDDFKNNFATYIERLRFRRSTNGDFYDEATENAFAPSFAFEGDWTSRETVLAPWLTDTTPTGLEQAYNDFRTAMTNMVSEVASDGGALEKWKSETVTINEICGSGNAGWEQIQYYLLNGQMTGNPEYYKATAGAEEDGQYWWKAADTRLINMTGSDSGWNTAYASRPTNATLTTLRQKMYDYAQATGDAKNVLAEKFRIWFNQETTLDLTLKNTTRGGNITSLNASTVATRMLELADAYNATKASSDVRFNQLTWSQIQYYAINQVTDGKVIGAKSAQKYTYNSDTTSRDWNWAALDNGWREALIPSITDLAELIRAVEAEGTALDPIADFTDLEAVGLDFQVPTSGDARATLLALKAAYEADGSDWADLANAANLDSAWYLIQHYLKTGALTAPTAGESVLDATATVGRGLYYWKDGWSENGWTRHTTASRVGVVDFEFLREAANSGVSARLNRMRTNGPATWTSQGLRDKNGAAPTWSQIVDAIDKSNTSTMTALWTYHIQFLLLHEDNANAQNAVASLAYSEGNIFYWWMNTTGRETVTLPSDLSALDGLNSGANAIMKSKLRGLATGDPASSAITDGAAIVDTVAAVNIRIPPTDAEKDLDEFKVRSGLHKYTESELQTAIANLVKKVYADNAPTTAAGVPWDFVDGNVFTYNKAAYDAVCKLGVYEIQHWLATGGKSYTPSDDDKAVYWWIEKDTKPGGGGGGGEEALKNMMTGLLGYGVFGMEAEATQLILDEWDKFGFTKTSTEVISDGLVIPTLAQMLTGDNMYSWLQFELLSMYGLPTTSTDEAQMYADMFAMTANPDYANPIFIDINDILGVMGTYAINDEQQMYLLEFFDEDTALSDLPEIDEDANSASEDEIPEKELQNGMKDEIIEQPVIPGESVTETSEEEPMSEENELVLPEADADFSTRPTDLLDITDYITEVQQNEEAA